MYNKEQVEKETLEYFGGNKLATNIFFKYALKNKQEQYLELTPDDMHRRMAKEFARAEAKFPNAMSESDIYELFKNFKWVVPQGSPMFGVGNDHSLSSLSNCVVVESPEDNVSSIMDSGKELANLFKRRAGVGIDISKLRPENTPVNNAAGTTSGAWSFSDFYSYVCRMIGQNGRRGALMISIDVRHPDVYQFVKMKHDLKKVTGANISVRISDEFMEAVEADTDFNLRFPVDSETPKFSKVIRAKDLWNTIISSATKTAEPGLLFWDACTKYLPANGYPGFKSITTNPCFSGDTLIAVADGRSAVTIKSLAEDGKDVDVYSVDPSSGEVSIKKGRNPRVTGYDKILLRVHLDNGTFLDVTENHGFLSKDGEKIEAQNLKIGDSLMPFRKSLEPVKKGGKNYYRINMDAKDNTKNKIYEHRLIAKFGNNEEWNAVYSNGKKNGWIDGGLVVHHKDYDSLNNNPENLQIMSFKEHTKLHSEIDTQGDKNGNFLGTTSTEIYRLALDYTKNLGRRFSTTEWNQFAELNKLPKSFSNMHHRVLGKDPAALSHLCAEELNIENSGIDPRLVKTKQKMIKQGYIAKIEGNSVFVEKQCENCLNSFFINHLSREISFCNQTCSSKHTNLMFKNAQEKGIHKHFEERSKKLKALQAKVYSDLKFKMGKVPQRKDWEEECKSLKISFRTGKNLKTSFKSWKEVKEYGETHNHKVTKIELLPGVHTVYNITVDDNHTLAAVNKVNRINGTEFHGVFTFQCGEIILSNDSCRLISINLKHFVKNPFTKNAYFDFIHFKTVVKKTMRLSDDLVELELEKLQSIINMCSDEHEKQTWHRLRESCLKGRRTGLGTHGLADAISRCSLRYDAAEALPVIEEIYECLRDEAYDTSCDLATERGSFPIFDWNAEKDNAFIKALPSYIKNKIKNTGRRNISILTNAPTGSVSEESMTSSGIEPVFKNSYTRRRKLDHSEANIKADFVDVMGDRWIEFKVFHKNVQEYLEMFATDVVPDFFVESDNIDWHQRIKVQATIQKFIDHSISSTINLPKGTPESVVSDLYLEGWKAGLKGVTVYVDGSRDGVLITDTPKKEEFIQKSAPKRKKELKCDIRSLTVKGEKWVVLVGLLEDKPYEVFGGLAKNFNGADSEKTGTIIKHGSGVYSLKTAEAEIGNIREVFENKQYTDLTRLISLSLRHGADIKYICEQILKAESESMLTFSKALARVLKTYIKQGEAVSGSGNKCPTCSESLFYVDGCATCKSCGWSKCA